MNLGRIKRFISRPMDDLYKASPSIFHNYAEQINEPAEKIYRHYIYCCYRYGIRPLQYVIFDFYRLNHRARRKFACNVKANEIFRQVNIFRRNMKEDCFGNKKRFDELYCAEIGRDFITSVAGNAEILAFLNKHPLVMLKPADGMRGIGIRKIDVTSCNPEKLAEEICKSNLVVEEVVEQCEEMARLNQSTVNTIRVVNVRDRSGTVHTVGCSLRMGRRGMAVDNVTQGGIMFPIDAEKGYVCGKGIDEDGHLYDCHPESGQLIIGFQVPRFRELLAFATKAMDVLPQQRIIGWDICIGADRFYLIEGNLYPGSTTFECDGIGKKSLLELAIK